MTRRFLCLLLAVIMILSLFLTSCSNKSSDEESEEETQDEEVLRKYAAVTIYGICDDSMTEEGLAAVEAKISNYCVARYKTSIDLRLYKESEYEAALQNMYDKFAAKKEEERIAKAAAKSSSEAEKELLKGMTKEEKRAYAQKKRIEEKEAEEAKKKAAEEEAKLVEEGKDKTVTAEEVQMDIIFLPTMEKYYEAVDSGLLIDLKDYLNKGSKVITDYIYPTYLTAATVNGGIYGLPTNQGVDTNETYFVVNRELAEKYGVDWSQVRSITDLEEVFAQIVSNEPGVTPIYGDFEPEDLVFYTVSEETDLGHMIAVNADQLLGGSFSSKHYYTKTTNGVKSIEFYDNTFTRTYSTLAQNQNFYRYAALKGEWRKAGYLSDTNENCFLSVRELTDEEVKNWDDDTYEIHLYRGARFTTEAALDNGVFGISSNCAGEDQQQRAMEILQLLYTDPELHNLFAFGIEDVHYVLNGDGKTVQLVNDSYKMDLFKTGNPLLGYLPDDMDPDYIERSKEKNLNSRVDAFLGLRIDWEAPSVEEWPEIFVKWHEVAAEPFQRLYYGIPDYEAVYTQLATDSNNTDLVGKTFSKFLDECVTFKSAFSTQAGLLTKLDEELHLATDNQEVDS